MSLSYGRFNLRLPTPSIVRLTVDNWPLMVCSVGLPPPACLHTCLLFTRRSPATTRLSSHWPPPPRTTDRCPQRQRLRYQHRSQSVHVTIEVHYVPFTSIVGPRLLTPSPIIVSVICDSLYLIFSSSNVRNLHVSNL